MSAIPPLPPPPASSNDVDKARLYVGAAVILSAMAVMLIVLAIAVGCGTTPRPASDIVAILGAVTTFLGTAVGLVFGVHATQGTASTATRAAQVASDAARTANETAKTANNTARAASNVAESATAALSGETTQLASRMQAMQMRSARKLHRMAAPEHRARADAIMAALELDPAAVYEGVLEIVTQAVAGLTGQAPEDIATERKIVAPLPDGYGITAGAYQSICDQCTDQINTRFGVAIELDGAWRSRHEFGTLDAFISDAARLVLVA